jgi:hypothetical protein
VSRRAHTDPRQSLDQAITVVGRRTRGRRPQIRVVRDRLATSASSVASLNVFNQSFVNSAPLGCDATPAECVALALLIDDVGVSAAP